MVNYVDGKPNMTDMGLNVESLVSCTYFEDKSSEDMIDDVEIGLNKTDEGVAEESSKQKETIDGKDNCNNENSHEGKYHKDRQIMEEQEDSERENCKKGTRKSKKTAKQRTMSKSNERKRKTKKELKEERMKIYSETLRLMREREKEICIPYHVAKQRTLQEIFARKKNRTVVPLYMPASTMMEIWRDIEESTKNAVEFFKSESDSDEEGCNNNDKKPGENDKKKQEKENCNKKSFLNFNNSNNNSSANNGNTIDSINDEIENFNPDLTKGKFECENINRNGNSVTNNDDNAMFTCEEQDLVNGNDKSTQEPKSSNGRAKDSFIAGDTASNPMVDGNPEIRSNTEMQVEGDAMGRSSDWVKNIPACEKHLKQKKKEMLLQKLNPKLLKITPKLSGEPDSLIDLENDRNKIEIGARNLKKRFIENCLAPRYKSKRTVELTITTSEKGENGEINNVATEKLIYNSPEVLMDPELEKPGAKLQRLREELKRKIDEKWDEEYKKNISEWQFESENKKIEENEVEEEEELIEDDEMEESDDTEESDSEDDVPVTKKKRNRFIDSEAEESNCEYESGNEGGDELDEHEIQDCTARDSCDVLKNQPVSLDKDAFPRSEYDDSQSSLIPPYQPGGGMLNGGSELTQNDGDISLPKNVLSPALRLSLELSPSNKNDGSQHWDIELESPEDSITKSNFLPCFPENKNFDLNDAYEFCSGKFPGEGGDDGDIPYDETNSRELVNTPRNDSQRNSKTGLMIEESEAAQEDESKKKKRSRLRVVDAVWDGELDGAVDDVNELETITNGRMLEDSDNSSEKSLPIRNRGAKKNLVFSDEEDDPETKRRAAEEDESGDEDSSQNGEEDPLEDEAVREVEYDSEEAEIVNPGEYFDAEAELSGSEWSGDEDERGLDQYEVEDGDYDKLDSKKVRSELEQIHIRTLLDDDDREVRLLQEILFEDGDLFDDGAPKRQKNFRWKDLVSTFDDDGNDGNDAGDFQGQEDLEAEEEFAKIRHEKELFLLQMKSKIEEMGMDEDEGETSLLKRGRVILDAKSTTTTVKKKVTTTAKAEVEDLSFKTPLTQTNKRGSFLSRNEEFLSRLAKSTSNSTDIFGAKHSKNFVFAAKSPGKEESSSKENSQPKRKASSPKGDDERKKKVKREVSTSKISILDRLT